MGFRPYENAELEGVDMDTSIALGCMQGRCDETRTWAVVYADHSYAYGIPSRAEAEALLSDDALLLSPSAQERRG